MTQKLQRVHLSFHCFGGTVKAGFDLFDFFSSYPLALHVYVRVAASAGLTALLGAKNRYAEPEAKFVMHAVSSKSTGVAMPGDDELAERARILDGDRVEQLLKQQLPNVPAADQNVRLTEKGAQYNGEQAIAVGLVSKISAWPVKEGTRVFRIIITEDEYQSTPRKK